MKVQCVGRASCGVWDFVGNTLLLSDYHSTVCIGYKIYVFARACRKARLRKHYMEAVFMLRSFRFSCHLQLLSKSSPSYCNKKSFRDKQLMHPFSGHPSTLCCSLQAYMSDRECEGWVGMTYQHKAPQRGGLGFTGFRVTGWLAKPQCRKSTLLTSLAFQAQFLMFLVSFPPEKFASTKTMRDLKPKP